MVYFLVRIYIFEDTLGLRYDLDIYNYATRNNSRPLIQASAKRIAEYYVKRHGEQNKAIPYIKSLHDAGFDYQANLVTAKYHLATDSLDLALRDLDAAATSEIQTPDLYLTYAALLNRQRKYTQSNEKLEMLEDTSSVLVSIGWQHLAFLKLRADNYRQLDDHESTLRYQDMYIATRDSLNNLRNREEINSYKVKFEVQKKELELAKQQEIIKWQSVTLWAVLILGGFSAALYFFFRHRKKRMLRLIVRQQKDFLRRKESVPDMGSVTADRSQETSDSSTGLSREKADALWALILHEMEENKIYADTTVTRDIFAQRVDCNHTWFSQVIREKTGKSYPQFMNSYRIEEAVRILSRKDEAPSQKEIAASLGFLSLSTYYVAFKQQMGMSPADYRKYAIADSQENKDIAE